MTYLILFFGRPNRYTGPQNALATALVCIFLNLVHIHGSTYMVSQVKQLTVATFMYLWHINVGVNVKCFMNTEFYLAMNFFIQTNEINYININSLFISILRLQRLVLTRYVTL